MEFPVSEVSQKIISRIPDSSGDILIPVGWEFEQWIESWQDGIGTLHARILVKKIP